MRVYYIISRYFNPRTSLTFNIRRVNLQDIVHNSRFEGDVIFSVNFLMGEKNT